MTNNTGNTPTAVATENWQLTALTEALGDLTLTVNDSLSVGRGSDNDVVLGSKQVSRNHALLSVLNDKLYVKDLNSSNGTFINDERIDTNESKHLATGDTLGFASFSFQVTAPVSAPVVQEQESADTPTLMLSPDTEIAPIVEAEPVVKETIIEDILPVESYADSEPVTTVQAEPMNSATHVDEPVIKETGITDVLSAADEAEPVLIEVETVNTDATEVPDISTLAAEQEVAKTTSPAAPTLTENESMKVATHETLSPASTHHESLVERPVLADEPVTTTETMPATETVLSEAPVTEPLVATESLSEVSSVREVPVAEPAIEAAHDKTTKTALQEEADPDVLRAKQAATAQFSGTANLGQPRDVGTTGNNAIDQALDNPATTGAVEKKASGSWFIWVFVAIIIIGLALWLFNTGMV